ncbi:MAG TPA: PAS domain S-box protein [Euryarchaeota archaeon]|nr:PAS domain S-box protein [Euryarchaeota archaeon]
MTKAADHDPEIFQTVFNSANDAIIALDPSGSVLLLNPKAREYLDTHTDPIGKKVSELGVFEETTMANLRELFSETLERGEVETEMELFFSKGVSSWAKLSSAVMKDQKGKETGIIIHLTDITDLKRSSMELMESEEKYRATVEQSMENIYIYDVETKSIVESNKAIQDLLGYSAEEMKSMRASDFIAHDDRNIISKVEEVLRKGHAFVGERRYRKKNGELVDVEVSASRITQGKRTMLCVVSRDITERKRYQEQLIEEKTRAEFYLDLLAHDMGNLLHGIQNGISALEIVRSDPAMERRIISMVKSLADRSMRLANNVITFSRMREEKLDLERIHLKELAEGAFKKAREFSYELDIDFRNDVPEDLVIVCERMFEEALYNLFHNSIRVQENKIPVLGIRARRTPRGTKIEVWDKGGGISDDMKNSLFTRYSEVFKRKHTGVGMTVIHMIVARHGGTIMVENRTWEEGIEGASFMIWIPHLELER